MTYSPDDHRHAALSSDIHRMKGLVEVMMPVLACLGNI